MFGPLREDEGVRYSSMRSYKLWIRRDGLRSPPYTFVIPLRRYSKMSATATESEYDSREKIEKEAIRDEALYTEEEYRRVRRRADL